MFMKHIPVFSSYEIHCFKRFSEFPKVKFPDFHRDLKRFIGNAECHIHTAAVYRKTFCLNMQLIFCIYKKLLNNLGTRL